MKIAGICFSGSGLQLEKRIQKKLVDDSPIYNDLSAEWFFRGKFAKDETGLSTRLEGSVHDWTAEHFNHCDVLLFIGACGIAVRAIAPFVRDKRHDPAVIVMDEMGRFCIPILSGHVGGANEFAAELADVLGGIPVITTATDIHNKFAVDVYAKKHNLTMSNATYAKEVSAAVVSGEPVGFYTNFPVEGELPEGLVWSEKLEQALEDNGERTGGISLGIYISPSYNRAYFDHTLWLIPRCLTVGIECGAEADGREVEQFVRDTLNSFSLYEEAVQSIAVPETSRDLPGIVEFCRRSGIPLHTFRDEQLKEKSGRICEQCASLDGGAELLTTRSGADGIACAVALTDWKVVFETT
jgi:cobalt-precorrin 5A hydrolase